MLKKDEDLRFLEELLKKKWEDNCTIIDKCMDLLFKRQAGSEHKEEAIIELR